MKNLQEFKEWLKAHQLTLAYYTPDEIISIAEQLDFDAIMLRQWKFSQKFKEAI